MATKAASEIVIGPVITERTYLLYTQGRYTFKVAADASKTELQTVWGELEAAQQELTAAIDRAHVRESELEAFWRADTNPAETYRLYQQIAGAEVPGGLRLRLITRPPVPVPGIRFGR